MAAVRPEADEAEDPARVLTTEADEAEMMPGAEDPARADPEPEAVPDRDLRLRDAAATKAGNSLIRTKTADPERIRSTTRKRTAAGTNPDVSTVPRRRNRFPLKSRSRPSLYLRRSRSVTSPSACTFRLPKSSRSSSCRAR